MRNSTAKNTFRETVSVQNETGVHTRPAHRIATITNRYPDRVSIRCGSLQVDAKSILDLLQLEARKGDQLEIRVEGKNGPEIAAELRKLFGDSFNE